MNATINYLMEVNIGLLLFMFVYWAILRNENQFSLKRAYLLLAMLGSLIFPLLHLDISESKQLIPSIVNLVPTYWLPEVVINGNGSVEGTVSPNLSPWKITEWIYLIAVLFFISLFLYRLIVLVRLFASNPIYRWQKYFVSESNEPKPTFSFFQYIFIGQANQFSKSEKEEILFHESIHIQKLHSFDILLVNIVGIVCWFNPIVRIYKKTLVQLHEFEADARSVENKDLDTYCCLLAKAALQSAEFPLANHFNNSLTLKRIQMMKTMKRKIRNWKIASVLAIVPLFFFAVACQDQVTSLKEIAKNSTVASSIPSEVKTQMDKLQRENPKKSYILIEMNEEGRIKLEDLKILNDENSNKLSNSRAKEYSSIHVIKTDKNAYDQERTFVILEKGEQTNQLAQMTATPDEVFTVVEESAAPKDGFDNMYQYIAKNLQYPKKARESKIEGKVFVQFIVNLDGSLSDFKVIKGIDEACDQEAIRVLKNGPIWNPGKQRGQTVKQQFTMPFVFSLNPQNTTPRVSEVQQNDEVMSVSFINSIDGNGKVVLKGQVLRKSDGTPLPGVNLVIKNRTEGSVTDSKGLFEFHPPIQKGEIVFSFVGFKSEEISF